MYNAVHVQLISIQSVCELIKANRWATYVEIVELGDAILGDHLRYRRIPLREPSKELGNTARGSQSRGYRRDGRECILTPSCRSRMRSQDIGEEIQVIKKVGSKKRVKRGSKETILRSPAGIQEGDAKE